MTAVQRSLSQGMLGKRRLLRQRQKDQSRFLHARRNCREMPVTVEGTHGGRRLTPQVLLFIVFILFIPCKDREDRSSPLGSLDFTI
jgi:hypothetical protein